MMELYNDRLIDLLAENNAVDVSFEHRSIPTMFKKFFNLTGVDTLRVTPSQIASLEFTHDNHALRNNI